MWIWVLFFVEKVEYLVLTPCDGYVSQPQSPVIVVVSRRFTAGKEQDNNEGGKPWTLNDTIHPVLHHHVHTGTWWGHAHSHGHLSSDWWGGTMVTATLSQVSQVWCHRDPVPVGYMGASKSEKAVLRYGEWGIQPCFGNGEGIAALVNSRWCNPGQASMNQCLCSLMWNRQRWKSSTDPHALIFQWKEKPLEGLCVLPSF